MGNAISLDLQTLRGAYRAGSLTPRVLVRALYRRLREQAPAGVWIHLLDEATVLARARKLEAGDRERPLWGIPFAVKDNIDVAGLPTSAGCPDYAYTAKADAAVVTRLLEAGAILIGKTNLDQFATGLVGTRSPYGACANAFNPAYISGGSSSGSAVAVAAGLVSFALGTDTAGSGRVPAGFNNIVGLKSSRGLLSTEGVVPACKTLDCVSVFALTVADAEAVLAAAAAVPPAISALPLAFCFGVPKTPEFFGDRYGPALFARAIERLQALGGTAVEIDFEPFLEAAQLLYEGPWIAERYAAIRGFFDTDPERLLPVTRTIIGKGRTFSAADAFQASYRLQALRERAAPTWETIDLLLVPTSPNIYTITEIEADPITLNSRLGYYTNFVNLMDLCALAVPAALREDGLPFGVTLIAPRDHDLALTALGARLQQASGLPLGATGAPQPDLPAPQPAGGIQLAVIGAHLRGQPLNCQLTERGARFLRSCRTSADYRLYALADTVPAKPGLIRSTAGCAIEVEVWELGPAAFGSFVAEIPPPLGIGTLNLEDGSQVKGFLCEAHALTGAEDITAYGGWRAYRATVDSLSPPATV